MNDTSRRMLAAWWLLNYMFTLALGWGFLQNSMPSGWQAWSYGIALWLTYSLVYILPAMLLGYLVWRLLYRRWPGLAWTLAAVFFGLSYLLIFADVRLYNLFGFHINSFVINLVTTPGGIDSLGSSGEAEVVFALIGLTLMLAPVLLLLPARWLASRHGYRRVGFGRKLVLLLVLLGVGERLAYGVSSLEYYSPVLKVADAFPLYNRVRFKTLAAKLGYENKRPRQVSAGMAKGDLNYPLKPLEVAPPEKPLNLVWLVAESLRWDMLTPEIMPNTWAFAGKSLKLEQHMSGGNGTRQGLFSLMYGLYGAYWNAFLREERGPVLLDLLKGRNYQFYMTTSASFTYPEFDRTLFAAIDDGDLHHAQKASPPWQRDIDNARAVSQFIQKRDVSRPFMSFFFFESTHARYDFPASSVIASPYLQDVNYALMSRKSLRNDIGQLKNRYINASHHVDKQIGSILATLEEQGLLESTIVVITGDHGEEFMEKGHWGHNAGFHEEQIRVPMVLHIPGREPSVIPWLTSHMDIIPTLMPLLGVKNPVVDYAQGEDIFASDRSGYVVASDWSGVAYIDDQYKFYVPYRSMSGKQNVLTTRDDRDVTETGTFYKSHMATIRQILKGAKIFTRPRSG
jgi:membrane-anchored protein YejM (alkaline phosphatase superfamily)